MRGCSFALESPLVPEWSGFNPEQFLRIPSVAVGETNAYPEFA